MKGHLHIVIAGYKHDTCFDTWLWDLGTTNADVSCQDARHHCAPAMHRRPGHMRAGLECSSQWTLRNCA